MILIYPLFIVILIVDRLNRTIQYNVYGIQFEYP